jgi:hypothetical protein
MSATHKCPIDGCEVTDLPRSILMCALHWRKVPRDLQRAVNRAWRARNPTTREGSDGTVGDHLQACEDAIAAVEGREPRELFA